MAGSLKFAVSCLLASVALSLAPIPEANATSSLSSFWQHELPHTTMPQGVKELASPLSASLAGHYLPQLKAGTLQASKNHAFCSSAAIYCSQKAVSATGGTPSQPAEVCIPPFFFYEYAKLRCNRGGRASASAARTSSSIFFSQNSLAVGHTMPLPDTSNDLKGMKFLPHSLAEALPELNERSMPALAKVYGIRKGSDMELEMENTLVHCAYKSEHELRACHVSGEGMVGFVTKAVGRNAAVYAPVALAKQVGRVVDIAVVSSKGSRVASCHDMKFPSLLYSCHMTQTSKLMDVSLELADGHVVRTPAICHMDTSYWNSSHIAFQVLNAKPGKSPICHWLPQNSFIFVEKS